MKVLLIGEYSRLHWTLSEGLRSLGHSVTVLSDGDYWKNYPRNISLSRPSDSAVDGARYLAQLIGLLPRMRGYDVVQLINPNFLQLKPAKSLWVYRYLKKYNKKVFLGAFGDDHYWALASLDGKTFRYSDFMIGDTLRDTPTNRRKMQEYLHGDVVRVNKEIAASCNGIIACLYEYYAAYHPHFPAKTAFIPLPINSSLVTSRVRQIPDRLKFFIGIQSERSDVKGTDVIYPILNDVAAKHPDKCSVTTVTSLPYDKYESAMNNSDVQIDQLYSYTPSMNSLLAMAKGLAVVGGGEEESYELLGEKQLRPIINVIPDKDDIYRKLEQLVLEKERIPELSRQSIAYIEKYHNHVKVAQRYVDFWEQK